MNRKFDLRPLLSVDIEALSKLVERSSDRANLLDILEELKHRRVPKARELRKLVERQLGEQHNDKSKPVLMANKLSSARPEVPTVDRTQQKVKSDLDSNIGSKGRDQNPLGQIVFPGATWRNGSDLWKALCHACHDNKVNNLMELHSLLGRIEHSYKFSEKQSAMPGKYRSNKSVLNAAFELGVPIFDNYGHPLGKTEVEKRCKLEGGGVSRGEMCGSPAAQPLADSTEMLRAICVRPILESSHAGLGSVETRSPHAGRLTRLPRVF